MPSPIAHGRKPNSTILEKLHAKTAASQALDLKLSQALDLQLLHEKLEAVAKEQKDDAILNEMAEGKTEIKQENGKHGDLEGKSGGDDAGPASVENPIAPQQSQKSTPSIIITPPKDDPPAEPTDFEIFQAQAEAKAKAQQALVKALMRPRSPDDDPHANPFYYNTAGIQSSANAINVGIPSVAATPGLANIHEVGEEHDPNNLITADVSSSSEGASSWGEEPGHNNTAIPLAPLETRAMGRHVSSPADPDDVKRPGTHTSVYHGGGRDSPEAPAKKENRLKKIWRAVKGKF